MLQALLLTVFALVLSFAQAGEVPAGRVYHRGLEPVTLEWALSQVSPGSVVVLGEQHGTLEQAQQQVHILEMLRKNGFLVSVGMEFFKALHQNKVDAWRAGALSESDFLQQISWGSFPFASYREQALFPQIQKGATTLALNAPGWLTGKIAKQGLNALTAEERSFLPPQFTLGNRGYFERFKRIMGDHLPTPQALDNYFAAQSTWDDTMAFHATEYMKAHCNQVLVIVVGDFHVQYGGGLPDRLTARGARVITFSLVNLQGLTDLEQKQAIEPSELDGIRADFVLTSRVRPQ